MERELARAAVTLRPATWGSAIPITAPAAMK